MALNTTSIRGHEVSCLSNGKWDLYAPNTYQLNTTSNDVKKVIITGKKKDPTITNMILRLTWEASYLLGMFFIISVVRLSSPRIMRSISSSYCFLFSAWLEPPSFLRLRDRSIGESKEFIIGIIWPPPEKIMHLWWWDWSPIFFGGICRSIQFPPTWGKMPWETNSIPCSELLDILMFSREPGWNPLALGDSPA